MSEATQEAALEEMLRGVEAKWGVMEFEIRRHKNQKDTYLLDGFDDIIALLEESNVCLMTAASSRCVRLLSVRVCVHMLVRPNKCGDTSRYALWTWRDSLLVKEKKDFIGSLVSRSSLVVLSCWRRSILNAFPCRFAAGVQGAVETLTASMRLLGDSVDAWMELQRMWIYLEPIFSAPDIQRQLPDESQQFTAIDRSFRAQVLAIRERRNVLQAFASASLLQACKQKNEVLEHILVRT